MQEELLELSVRLKQISNEYRYLQSKIKEKIILFQIEQRMVAKIEWFTTHNLPQDVYKCVSCNRKSDNLKFQLYISTTPVEIEIVNKKNEQEPELSINVRCNQSNMKDYHTSLDRFIDAILKDENHAYETFKCYSWYQLPEKVVNNLCECGIMHG